MTVSEKANKLAAERFIKAHPVLTGVRPALEVIPGMKPNRILHAGPPIDYTRMCENQKAAVLGACQFEGLARDEKEARRIVENGDVELIAAHDGGAIGGGTGVTTASMPVAVVMDQTYGGKSYHFLMEGFGKTLVFGAYDKQVEARLKWFQTGFGPALNEAVKALGSVDLKAIIGEALLRGDELHNRNKAATSIFHELVLGGMLKAGVSRDEMAKANVFLRQNHQFFVCLVLPAMKVCLLAADGVKGSSMVTVMARNGVDFGIKVSGLGARWFTGPAQRVRGKYYPGFTAEDANPDIGDSSICETGGLGAFALAASPAGAEFMDCSLEEARKYREDMHEICISEHDEWRVPSLSFRGTSVGIDCEKVVNKGILPVIDTSINHKLPGKGMIGVGIVHPPMECFQKALQALSV